ncbi:hypothetical protein H6503_02885 [Candidatus Woesearchaeota archaeon]|nr:hypothetical protein [Candidatus Woesearchaeota archaeon]
MAFSFQDIAKRLHIDSIIGKKKQGDNIETQENKEGTAIDPNVITNDEEMLAAILKKITELTDEFSGKIQQIENKIKDIETKLEDDSETSKIKDNIQKIQSTLDEFSKFYELVCKQYDPFTNADSQSQQSMQQISPEPAHSTSEVEAQQAMQIHQGYDDSTSVVQDKKKTSEPLKKESKPSSHEIDHARKLALKTKKIDLRSEITKAEGFISKNEVHEAEELYKQIMADYHLSDPKDRLEIYHRAINLRNDIKRLKNN